MAKTFSMGVTIESRPKKLDKENTRKTLEISNLRELISFTIDQCDQIIEEYHHSPSKEVNECCPHRLLVKMYTRKRPRGQGKYCY